VSGARIVGWPDRVLLTALHLRDCRGLSNAAIAAELAQSFGMSVSRVAVIGQLARIDRAADAHDDIATAPENRDGGMAPLWWAPGADKQDQRRTA